MSDSLARPHLRWLVLPLCSLSVLALSLALSALPARASHSGKTGGWLPNQFTLFESGQVRPLALSDDGRFLYAVNTPDNRLEIFQILNRGSRPLKQVASVQVGLEPVAVAVRGSREVWVVNHLSDSVSIVDVSPVHTSRVVRTLLVGDEPRDIVFAGENGDRAFITTAHRGQNHPLDPQLTTPGIGRADVWVFDANRLGSSFGGDPLTIVTFFADTPRALAVTPDGRRVYAAAFLSGNRTSVVPDTLVTNGGESAPDGRGLPAPTTNYQGIPQPETGLIVRYDGSRWVDPAGRVRSDQVRFNLPDLDVFVIDATGDPPAEIPGTAYSGVGTVLFNMVVNPVNGRIYVTNTEARNDVRFEGPGFFGQTTVRGRTHDNRITVLNRGRALPRRLNKHIDFDSCCDPIPNRVNDRSLAIPLGMAVSGDGQTLYVAAFGSSKVGIFSTDELEDDSFVPDDDQHIELSGGGPSGLVLDERHQRLYVFGRFDNAISVVDPRLRRETAYIRLANPEPADVVAGRPFLYDARLTSSHGNSACASCHVFGDLDQLAWDLGNPDGDPVPNPGPFVLPLPPSPFDDFQPLKGPMVTQSLRGMANHGPMHWRGDRTGVNDVAVSEQPDTGLFNEMVAFEKFNVAFPGLVGRHAELSEAQMKAFARFALQITYPPNPIRRLDNALTPAQARGRDHYFRLGTVSGAFLGCNSCHRLDPDGNAEFGVERPGFFGSSGLGIVEGTDFEPPTTDLQHFKIPHLRNLYQKVGMFGLPRLPDIVPHSDASFQGDQIRGFGFTHDGSFDTLFRFMFITSFSNAAAPAGFGFGTEGDPARRDVEQFLLAYDSNLAPVVGQQVTLRGRPSSELSDRLDLLLARASADPPECELVAKGRPLLFERGYLFVPRDGVFLRAENGRSGLTPEALRRLALFTPVTFTCVPPGSGYRMGLDADLDGCFDISERKLGSDPRDPRRRPRRCP